MNVVETGFVSTNAILLAIFYTIFGALLSYAMYHLFNEFDDEWKQKTILFQITDVTLEVSILASVAFWTSEIINVAPPFLPVRRELDNLVDSYISGIFFIFAVFVFMDQLTEKLKYLFARILGPTFNKIFPQYGSIVDLSLSYSPPRKTDKDNYMS
ncbi:MAG: hypothetical protein EB127_00385 [Alphaproteobacteria bacterium]|nr:hypothetical protein [Alphaproteobacteria bacterium]